MPVSYTHLDVYKRQRMPGSLAVALAGVVQGAQMIRVHDVAETRQALSLWRAATTGEPA